MIFYIFIGSISHWFCWYEVIGCEFIIFMLVHKLQFVFKLINELDSCDIETRLGYTMYVLHFTLLTCHLSSLSVEKDQIRITTLRFVFIKSDDSIQNVKFSNYSLFSFLSISINAPIVDVYLVCDSLIFTTWLHIVMQIMCIDLFVILIDG